MYTDKRNKYMYIQTTRSQSDGGTAMSHQCDSHLVSATAGEVHWFPLCTLWSDSHYLSGHGSWSAMCGPRELENIIGPVHFLAGCRKRPLN